MHFIRSIGNFVPTHQNSLTHHHYLILCFSFNASGKCKPTCYKCW